MCVICVQICMDFKPVFSAHRQEEGGNVLLSLLPILLRQVLSLNLQHEWQPSMSTAPPICISYSGFTWITITTAGFLHEFW